MQNQKNSQGGIKYDLQNYGQILVSMMESPESDK